MAKGAFGEQEARTPPVPSPSTAELRHALGPVGTATFHDYRAEICKFSGFHTCPSLREKLVEFHPNPTAKKQQQPKTRSKLEGNTPPSWREAELSAVQKNVPPVER